MTSYLKKDTKPVINDIHTPQNYSNPLRLAFLGGSKSGKTSTISKLKLGNFPDTYYPTHQTNPILFNYNPSSEAQQILRGTIPKTKDIVLSKTLQSNDFTPVNPIYKISNNNQVSRILVEVIDTPSFNPHQVVPFLEASLHSDLGKEILRNLANEPRKPVSTNPLLVASGAGELNGNINGYFLVYSAIASYSPPGYEGVDETLDKDHSFNLLPIIKDALDEAWWEYGNYLKKKNLEKEQDVFSFKVALRNLMKDSNSNNSSSKRNQNDEEEDFYLPPIWIICTHKDNALASPKLILQGKELAKKWGCGFIAIDNLTDNVDDALALMIRDVIEHM